MIFVRATASNDNSQEVYKPQQPRELLVRLLSIMEKATYATPEVLCVEIMEEVDRWDCVDETQAELMKLLQNNGIPVPRERG